MSLATYAGLTAAVPAWLDNRQDLGARIPEFVALAEAKLNRRLRARRQVTRVTLSPDAETWPLPDDFAAARTLRLLGGSKLIVEPVSAEAMAGLYAENDSPGEPRAFAIEGQSLVLWPPPADVTDLRLTYWALIPPAATADNWVLAGHPDVYLYGTVAEGWSYLGNNEEATKWAGLFVAAIEEISAAALSETSADRLTPLGRAAAP